MTLLGVLTAFAVLGGLVLVAVLFMQRGRDGVDLSIGGLLRPYLYLGSLAGVVVFAVGVAGILSYVLAAGFGLDVIYGGPVPQPAIAPAPCPPNTVCPPIEVFRSPIDDRVRRHGEDLVRGVTFLLFGGVFWVAHWLARRNLGRADEALSGLHRAYLMLGTRNRKKRQEIVEILGDLGLDFGDLVGSRRRIEERGPWMRCNVAGETFKQLSHVRLLLLHNGLPFTGRGRADDHSNHS